MVPCKICPTALVGAGAVLAAMALPVRAEAASPAPLTRYGVDDGIFRSLVQHYPAAADRLSRGEELLRNGKTESELEQALSLFQQAIALVPHSELIRRRKCQALTLLGRHADAVKACAEALYERNTSGLALRATVGALMSGPEPVTSTELGYAIVHSLHARQVLSSEPAGYAGQCDIAEKLGDVEMLKACIRELNRLAPKHQETLRAEAFLASMRPAGKTAVAWIALIALCIATAVHSFLRRGRLMARGAAVAALLVVLALPRSSLADTRDAPGGAAEPRAPSAGHLSKFPIDDDHPESSVPTAAQRDGDPVEYGYFIMDLGDHAEWAIQKGDHRQAAHFYQTLAKAVPDMAVGYVKACEQFEQAKDLDAAVANCAAALTAKGVTLADYSHYARLALQKKSLTPADLSTLDAAAAHLKADTRTQAVGLDIECTLGAHESDRARLDDCAPKLAALAPDNPKALFYQWALAIQKRDFPAAERYLARAKAKAPAAQITQMESAMLNVMPVWRKGLRAFRDWRVGALMSVVLALGLAALLLRRRAETTAPSA